jgi:hypothetical protein
MSEDELVADEEVEGFECSDCDADVAEEDRYCWNCGRFLDPLGRCPECGTAPKTGDIYCRQCGTALPSDED